MYFILLVQSLKTMHTNIQLVITCTTHFLKKKKSNLLGFVLFWGQVSCSSGWSQTYTVAKNDLGFLTCPCLSGTDIAGRHFAPLFKGCLRSNPGLHGFIGKQFTDRATSPAMVSEF